MNHRYSERTCATIRTGRLPSSGGGCSINVPRLRLPARSRASETPERFICDRERSDLSELSPAADRLAPISCLKFAVDVLEVRTRSGAPLSAASAGASACRAFVTSPAASHACASVTAASSEVSRAALSAAASAAPISPATTYARDSTRLSHCSSQAGTDHPDRALATICTATLPRPSASSPHAAGRQATAPISLSGLTSRAASTCLSRLHASCSSWCSRCTQASATSAAGRGAGGCCSPAARAAVARVASFAAWRSRRAKPPPGRAAPGSRLVRTPRPKR